MEQADVAGLFDAEAARFDRAYDEPGPEGRQLRQRLAATVQLLGDGPGDLLDAGTGPGRLCAEASRQHWRAIGVDISEAMVAMARHRLRGTEAIVVRASVNELPFAAASFDAVVATGLIGYLTDTRSRLAEFDRLIRPGGRLIISLPNVDSIHYRWRRHVWYPASRLVKRHVDTSRSAPPRRPMGMTMRQLEELVASQGMTVRALEYIGVAALLARLESVIPSATRWLTGRLERRRTRLTRLLTTQIVISVEKAVQQQSTWSGSGGSSLS